MEPPLDADCCPCSVPGCLEPFVHESNPVCQSIVLEPRVTERGGADWHCAHDCEYYYTCAVDTQQIEKVLESTRSLIIKRHLRGWGLTS